ncbi:MAG: hypothetical protein D6694_09755 [Gammaproteobacteria bacterium]|nr:MAG: hypothetical protein D6694_09755 [Gammaproteobacteria bacterium]
MSKAQIIETVHRHLFTANDPVAEAAKELGIQYEDALDQLLNVMEQYPSRPFGRFLKKEKAALLVAQWWVSPSAPASLINRLQQEAHVQKVMTTHAAQAGHERIVVLFRADRASSVRCALANVARLIERFRPITIISSNHFMLGANDKPLNQAARPSSVGSTSAHKSPRK